MNFLSLVTDVGFPIAASVIGGYFIFLILRFILEGVLKDIQQQMLKFQAKN